MRGKRHSSLEQISRIVTFRNYRVAPGEHDRVKWTIEQVKFGNLMPCAAPEGADAAHASACLEGALLCKSRGSEFGRVVRTPKHQSRA